MWLACFLIPTLQSVTPIYDSAGRLTHYVGIQSDITELVNHRKAELAAKHAALQACGGGEMPGRLRIQTHVLLMAWVHCMLGSLPHDMSHLAPC